MNSFNNKPKTKRIESNRSNECAFHFGLWQTFNVFLKCGEYLADAQFQ